MRHNSQTSLQEKINDRSAKVAIIGLGYVGLPLLRAFWEGGHPVIGFDVDEDKVDKLRRGENYLKHLGDGLVSDMLEISPERFRATCAKEDLAEADVLVFCVPTPLGEHNEPDMTYIEATCRTVASILRPGQLVSLESTTYPGTTREIILPILEASGLEVGKDFYLAYSPEREDPGRKNHNTQTIPKLVGGIDKSTGELAAELYRHAVQEVILVDSAEIAESAKLLENIYRAVNIALVNELKVVFEAMGVDIWKVIEAAATKPFGFQAFYPGPGLGGHCIPIDPFYLTWKAKEFGCFTRFIELAGEINTQMPNYVVSTTQNALNSFGKSVKGSSILVLGLAYKSDVDDMRESPSFKLIDQFKSLGATVCYHDPYIPVIGSTREHADLEGLRSVNWDEKTFRDQDAIVISTHHNVYRLDQLANWATLIVDSRNAMKGFSGPAKIIKS